MNALKLLGHNILPVDTTIPNSRNLVERIGRGVWNRIGYPLDVSLANLKLLEAVKNNKSDILWVDKGLEIKPNTLAQVKLISPNTIIVGYSPDDMLQPHNQSRYFIKALPLFDYYLTTKSFNISELKGLGVKHPIFIENGYDSDLHKPMNLTDIERDKYGGKIGFIGAWEKEREDSLLCLAKAGFSVRWWGWHGKKSATRLHPNLRFENKPLWGADYVKAINAFDINLCFLRKINRDLQTTRSIEIPASGGFMLAEKTDEHLKLFEQKKEADFFSCNDELVDMVSYYIDNPIRRLEIAKAGRLRCINSLYSNQERLRLAIEQIK